MCGVNVRGDCGFAVGYMRRVVMGLQRRVVVGFRGGMCKGSWWWWVSLGVCTRGEFSVGLPGFITLTDIDGIAYQDEPHQESGWLAWTKYL